LQGKDSNYDTDVFSPIIAKIAELSGVPYSADPSGMLKMWGIPRNAPVLHTSWQRISTFIHRKELLCHSCKLKKYLLIYMKILLKQ
jgi:alanyl-tRNA synthetase